MMVRIEEIKSLSASDLASRRRVRELIASIEALSDEDDRDEALYALAKRLDQEWMLDQARAVAELMSNGVGEKVEVLSGIGLRLARLRDAKQARQTFELAIAAARACEPLWLRADALLCVARVLSRVGLGELANETLTEATDSARQGESGGPQDALDASGVLGEIAEEWVLMGTRERALAIAQQIRNEARRDRALGRIQAMADIMLRGQP